MSRAVSSRPPATAARPPGSKPPSRASSSGRSSGAASSLSDKEEDSDSLARRLDKIMQFLKENRNRSAANLAMRALKDHPGSTELAHMLAQAQVGVKWFPHFRDALVHVALTGPVTTFTIGDILTVKFDYSHQKPAHENKQFKPFSDSLQSLVKRHDEKVMRNCHLPDEQLGDTCVYIYMYRYKYLHT